ncbi:pyrroline-5-carboxylate reductase [Erythrobacter longus]|uniref:Pyrroline-5-carboxylate reductase n=1 Tax=Erythrobacter longus TaxID=1044 RepID=A0A074MCC8_ERYLO|nr:pyrroline-5-carboxylate reductase dimerization domain-containing protein [Erythrobacter longus]KEO90415.1 pyrroline-5-carboxylate reductase [Erythrobacter longus]
MAHIQQLLIIGCGNMGGAMLAGWLAAGIDPARFAILDPGLERAPQGVVLYRDVAEAEAAGAHDAVLLGFKPQQLGKLAPGLRGLTGNGIEIYSLLAGLTIAQLKTAFPSADAHIRVMPNLAARINKSPIILFEDGLGTQAKSSAFAFFEHLGTALWLDNEAKFDLVTALAGSGPGFVYRFIDALAEAAVNLGLEQVQATSLALSMVEGASSLAANADASPGILADRVASPGGMTREGLNVLDADKALVKLLTRTLKATADKGAQLSAEAD